MCQLVIDFSQDLQNIVQPNGLDTTHIRQRCQLIEISPDALQLDRELFQPVHHGNLVSQGCGANIGTDAHSRLVCFGFDLLILSFAHPKADAYLFVSVRKLYLLIAVF